MTVSSNKAARLNELIDWTMPEIKGIAPNDYVEFYVRHPLTGELKRVRKHFGKYKDCQIRAKMMQEYIKKAGAKLADGWTPFDEKDDRAEKKKLGKSFAEVSKAYLDTCRMEVKQGTLRPDTLRDYVSRMKVFSSWAVQNHVKNISDLTPTVVTNFMHYRFMVEELSPKTVNNDRRDLFTFSSWCVKQHYMTANPVSGVPTLKENPRQLEVLTDKELSAVTRYLKERDRWFLLAVYFEYYTMIRPKELRFLQVKHIDFQDHAVLVPGSIAKNGKSQYVSLPDTLYNYMVDLALDRYDGEWYLFTTDRNTVGVHPGVSRCKYNIFTNPWVRVRKALGLNIHKKFYSLKSNGLTDLANMEGVVFAKEQARHSNISITNKYLAIAQIHGIEKIKRFKGKM